MISELEQKRNKRTRKKKRKESAGKDAEKRQ